MVTRTRTPSSASYGSSSSTKFGGNNGSTSTNTTASVTMSTNATSRNSFNSITKDTTDNTTRKFQGGRNSFRKTLMLRKKNQTNNTANSSNNNTTTTISSLSRKKKGGPSLLGDIPLSTSEDNVVSSSDEEMSAEEREGGSSSPQLRLEQQQQQQQQVLTPTQHTPKFSSGLLAAAAAASKKKASELVSSCPPESEKIPIGHIERILQAFGNDNAFEPLDLYRDVLHVSPNATERDVRIAYFRRGREVLNDAGFHSDNKSVGSNSTKSNDIVLAAATNILDPLARKKFQAVSMAYEILSTPAWKEAYHRNGGLAMPTRTISMNQSMGSNSRLRQKVSSLSGKSIPGSARPTPALRESTFRSGNRSLRAIAEARKNRTLRQPSVRWKDHVEELLFDNHPNEHAVTDDEDSDSDDNGDCDNDYGVKHEEEDDIIENSFAVSMNSLSNAADLSASEVSSLRVDRSGSANDSSIQSMSSSIATSATNSSRKRRKSKVVIDSDELESTLQLMDSEAEKHFKKDFWDNFEESLDGIVSMVDSIGDSSKRYLKRITSRKQKFQDGIGKRSLSQDSGEMEREKRGLGRVRTPTPSLLADDELPFKRSNSFPPRDQYMDDSSSVGGVVTTDLMTPSQTNAMTEAGTVPVTPDTALSSPGTPISLFGSKIKSSAKHFVTDQEFSPVVVPPGLSPTDQMALAKSKTGKLDSPTLFRPISPGLTVASDGTSKGCGSEFEMESLQMSELENPFRDPNYDPQRQYQLGPQPDSQTSTKFGGMADNVDVSFDSSNTKTTANTSKGKRVNASMVTNGKENLNYVRNAEARVSNFSKGESTEDVFDGVDGAQQHFNMAAARDTANLGGQDISLKRTASSNHSDCMSDLSESVFQYGNTVNHPVGSSDQNNTSSDTQAMYSMTPDQPGQQQQNRAGAATPLSETSTATTLTSNRATPKSAIQKTHSEGSMSSTSRFDPLSAMDLLSTESTNDGASVHSVESAVDASGFFEYFLAYVSAIVTECASFNDNGPDFGQDVLGLFSDEASVHTVENREPPTPQIPPVTSSMTSVTSATSVTSTTQ